MPFCVEFLPYGSRKVVSKVRWNVGIEMVEVTAQKGALWKTIGVACSGMVYCSFEEVP